MEDVRNKNNNNKQLISLLKVNNSGWNIQLFKNENKINDYLCTACNNVCCDAVGLECKTHNDDDDDIFESYCDCCLQQIIQNNNNQCPIHSLPAYIVPWRGFRGNILKSNVICPFSQNIIKKTCTFNGTLNDLLNTNHLEECKKKYDDENEESKQTLFPNIDTNEHKYNNCNSLKSEYNKIEIQKIIKMEGQNDTKQVKLYGILQELSQLYHQHIVSHSNHQSIENQFTLKTNKNNMILICGFIRRYCTHYIPLELIQLICSLYYAENIPFIESLFNFDVFYSKSLNETDFTSKPMVLLLGSYSSGKSSIIRYLMGRDFPIRYLIAPEPTTNSYNVIMNGLKDRVIPGPDVVLDKSKPFESLNQFGAGFLNKFECIEVTDSPILESVTFIDSPGIIASVKNRITTPYDRAKVIEWFANKCDRILIVFDAKQLTISDELAAMLEILKTNRDKIHLVINKADSIEPKELLYVYGKIMWSLGKIFNRNTYDYYNNIYNNNDSFPVYIGSFWDKKYRKMYNANLFDVFSNDLIKDLLIDLQIQCVTRRIKEFDKRLKRMRVHALIIDGLQTKLKEEDDGKSHWFSIGKKTKKSDKIFNKDDCVNDDFRSYLKGLAKAKGLNLYDFPNPEKFKDKIQKYEIAKYPLFKEEWNNAFVALSNVEIPKFMEIYEQLITDNISNNNNDVQDDIFNVNDYDNIGVKWSVVLDEVSTKYSPKFYSLTLRLGKASGNTIKNVMLESNLSHNTLRRIWDLSDIDQDGQMDLDEFLLSMYWIEKVQNGTELPSILPMEYVPLSKKHLF